MSERHIYLWDIHSNQKFLEIIEKYDDWKTLFVITWDIFDRGLHAYEIAEKIKELILDWKIEGSLWNHDIFLFAPYYFENDWSHNSDEWELVMDVFSNQFMANDSFSNTIESIIKWVESQGIESKYYISEHKTHNHYEYIKDLAKIFIEHFNLYYIDSLNNLTIHWWIPILLKWELVWDVFDSNLEWEPIKTTYFGLDYVKKLNELFKKWDFKTLKRLTTYASNKDILKTINKRYWTYYHDHYSWDFSQYLPTWFDNSNYIPDKEEKIDIYNSLRHELNKNWLKRLIVWHYWNQDDDNFSNVDDCFNDTIVRLDRSHRCDIWIMIINVESNEIQEIISY